MCATPVSLSGLAANDHTFMVHAFDAAGNTSQTSYGWTIDPTVPSAPSVSGPTGYANSSSAQFVWSDSDPVTFSCSLDGAPAATCSSPTDLSGLGDGTHSFAVSAINGSKSSTVSDTWIVDTTAPVLHVTAVPTDGASTNSNAVSPQVTQTEANPGTVSCSLTGPTPSPTCGPYIGIADGSYVLTINTTDLAGNAAAPLVTHWTVDTVAPPAPVVPTPTGPNPTITFTGGEPGDTFLCSVDGGAFVACTSPWTPPAGLSDGSHTLVVASVDAAGNKTASAPISFIVKTASAATGDTTAPTATITVPATLTGSAVVTFNEPVHGLAAKGVVYGVTGSTTVLPANVVCLNGGTPAACAGTFTAVRMTPKSVLVPGQRYTVAAQAGATHDAAGNASVAASKAFRGATSVEEDNVAVHAAWPTVKAKSALGGSYVREHLRGATASWSFAGASITWWTRSGADQGNAAVYIDGVKKATFNNYAATAHARVARTVKGLKKGAHTIRIQVLGTKSAKSRGTFVAVDGFTVGKVVTKTPALTMVLRRLAGSHYLASHAAVADVAGEAVTMTFRGTAITWSTVRGSNQGKAAIYVDGVLKATFDNYANKTGYGVKRTVSHLADKVHTVKVVVLGKHHKGAKGNLVTVDRFTIA
jgi:hypothetical protein